MNPLQKNERFFGQLYKYVCIAGIVLFTLFGFNQIKGTAIIENRITRSVSFSVLNGSKFIIDNYPFGNRANDRLYIQSDRFLLPIELEDYVMPENRTYFDSISRETTYSVAETQAIYRRLLKIWNKIAEEQGIPYWITGGTLLGWYWNYEFLPWEPSAKIQVPSAILFHLDIIKSSFEEDQRVISKIILV